MGKKRPPGRYRVAFDIDANLEVFLASVREHAPVVLAALRDDALPRFDPSVTRGRFADAVHGALCAPRCRATAPLRTLADGGSAPGEAPGVCDDTGGATCSAATFLVHVVRGCAERDGPPCLAREALTGVGGPADPSCRSYLPLEAAVRGCIGANRDGCRARSWLRDDPPDERENQVAADADAVGLLEVVWTWAERFGLVAGQAALHRLESSQLEDMLSPELTFHRSLLLRVYDTLAGWAGSLAAREVGDWAEPEPHAVAGAHAALEHRHGADGYTVMESPGPSLPKEPSGWPRFEVRQDDPGRYDITFRPPAWDMVGESRVETVERIVDEFRRHLAAALERFEMDTRRPGGAAGPGEALDLLPPGGLDPRTARLLVGHQVLAKPLGRIGREDDEIRSCQPQHWSSSTRAEVERAARVLVGPHFKCWLRPRRGAGRPPNAAGTTDAGPCSTPPPEAPTL